MGNAGGGRCGRERGCDVRSEQQEGGVYEWSSPQPEAAHASGDAPPSCATLLRRPLTPPSCAAQDLVFVVELSAVPGKDEEIIDILEAEAEEAAAAKAALGAKVAPKQPED